MVIFLIHSTQLVVQTKHQEGVQFPSAQQYPGGIQYFTVDLDTKKGIHCLKLTTSFYVKKIVRICSTEQLL